MSKAKPIFEYTNYREYLADYYSRTKAERPAFSYRVFARLAECKSPSTLKRVIAGERNLTEDGIAKFGKALKLNKQEQEFFASLVRLNQAKTNAEKQECAVKLSQSRKYRQLHPLTNLQMNYYRNWFYIPVRELVGLKGFKDDPEWIAAQISPKITPVEARRALEDLVQMGLLERAPDGKIIMTTKNVSTGNEMLNAFLTEFHNEMTKKSIESIERHPREKRDISSITVGISAETAAQIKAKIQTFRKELLELAANDSESNVIYQLNFQMFPLTEEINGGD
ncbi:MAG: TIGR02147 family protein [Bdellovibrionia bacterium]